MGKRGKRSGQAVADSRVLEAVKANKIVCKWGFYPAAMALDETEPAIARRRARATRQFFQK